MKEIDRILNDFELIWTILTVPGAYKIVWGLLNLRLFFLPFDVCLKGLRAFVSVLHTTSDKHTVSVLFCLAVFSHFVEAFISAENINFWSINVRLYNSDISPKKFIV